MLNTKNGLITADDGMNSDAFRENGGKVQCVGLIDTEGSGIFSGAPIAGESPTDFSYDISNAGLIRVSQKSFTLLHGMN